MPKCKKRKAETSLSTESPKLTSDSGDNGDSSTTSSFISVVESKLEPSKCTLPKPKTPKTLKRKTGPVFSPFKYRTVRVFPIQNGTNTCFYDSKKQYKIASYEEFIDTECETIAHNLKAMGAAPHLCTDAVNAMRLAMNSCVPTTNNDT